MKRTSPVLQANKGAEVLNRCYGTAELIGADLTTDNGELHTLELWQDRDARARTRRTLVDVHLTLRR